MRGVLAWVSFAVVLCGIGASVALPYLSEPPTRFRLALDALEDGRPNDAAALFQDSHWRGIAEYRAGRFRSALGQFFLVEDVRNTYNMGNAYAQVQEWRAAKAAYRKVLRLVPDHGDAKHNLDVVLRAEAEQTALLEAARNTKRMGQWEDGNQENDPEAPESDDPKTKPGDATEGQLEQAKSPGNDGGVSDQLGALADETMAADAGAGISNARGDKDAAQDLQGGSSSAPALPQSQQAAEVLLRQIEDNPARVLAARFRAIQKARREGQ